MNKSVGDLRPRARRSNVFMQASLESDGLPMEVRLRNLSAKGVLVEGTVLPDPETRVMFRKGELLVSGTVIWREDRHAGVAFDVELAPEQVLRHIPVPRPPKHVSSKRPPVKGCSMTPGERKIAHDYIFGDPIPGIDD